MDTNMGQLKPGVTLIYERQGEVVYAREFGADPSTRVAIGWDWEPEDNPARVRSALRDSVLQNQLWHEIRTVAKTHPALQEELDRVITMYHLIKDNGNETQSN
jgi:hypothetical protein